MLLPMTADEHRLTEDWFDTSIMSLTADEIAIDAKLDDAEADVLNDWLIEKGRIHGMLSMVMAAQERFFDEQDLALVPPSQGVIDETIARCSALAEEIAAANRATAIAHLVGDVSTFISNTLR